MSAKTKDIASLASRAAQDPDALKQLLALCQAFSNHATLLPAIGAACSVIIGLAKAKATGIAAVRSIFLESLAICLESDNDKIAIAAFDKFILILKDVTESHNEFQSNVLLPFLTLILSMKLSSALLAKIASMLNTHSDLRYFFLKNAAKILSVASKEKHTEIQLNSTYTLLTLISPQFTDSRLFDCTLTGAQGEKVSKLSKATYRRAFSACWLALFKFKLPNHMYLAILESLHQKLIPHLSNPVLLMDFLVDAYDSGGVVSLLALNGLFTLIHQHNLDYPYFYQKLYALFDQNLLHYKYRARFFRLVDLFLSSTYLPASMVCAFIKRMARLCLFAPPAGIIIVLPLIYNLLKRHPSAIRMIHVRDAVSEQMQDPFVFEELDPEKCHAQSSCLWELQILKAHAIPTVSGLARIFEDSLAKPAYDLEDFMDYRYKGMVDADIEASRRKRKRASNGDDDTSQDASVPTCTRINPGWLEQSLWIEQ